MVVLQIKYANCTQHLKAGDDILHNNISRGQFCKFDTKGKPSHKLTLLLCLQSGAEIIGFFDASFSSYFAFSMN